MNKALNIYIRQFGNKEKSFALSDGESIVSKDRLEGIVDVIKEFQKAKIYDINTIINFDIPCDIRLYDIPEKNTLLSKDEIEYFFQLLSK